MQHQNHLKMQNQNLQKRTVNLCPTKVNKSTYVFVCIFEALTNVCALILPAQMWHEINAMLILKRIMIALVLRPQNEKDTTAILFISVIFFNF